MITPKMVKNFLSAKLSRGISNKKADITTKDIRILSCFGNDKISPCTHLQASRIEGGEGKHICGGCGCGDKPRTWLTIEGEYAKLDYPKLSCPLKMPGFTDYEEFVEGDGNPRKREIELYLGDSFTGQGGRDTWRDEWENGNNHGFIPNPNEKNPNEKNLKDKNGTPINRKTKSIVYITSERCGWCKKADPIIKKLQNEMIEIRELYVTNPEHQEEIKEIKNQFNLKCGTPLLVDTMNGEHVCGFKEDAMLELGRARLDPSKPPLEGDWEYVNGNKGHVVSKSKKKPGCSKCEAARKAREAEAAAKLQEQKETNKVQEQNFAYQGEHKEYNEVMQKYHSLSKADNSDRIAIATDFNNEMWKLYNEGKLPENVRPGQPENYDFTDDPNGLMKRNKNATSGGS
jgi:thiol-disulfide isomerase/thioredoxin